MCSLLKPVMVLLCLVFIPEALSQSCTEIRSDIQQDSNCATLLSDIESESVAYSDIPIIQEACASSQCRSNMDNYMYEKSCGTVSIQQRS